MTFSSGSVGHSYERALAGINWPNAARVYVNQWDQGISPTEVAYADRASVWAAAAAHGVKIVRSFWWDEATINTYNSNPSVALARLEDMLDAAWAQGIRLVLSNLLDRATIERLNNSTAYASDLLAEQAMVTSGSTPWDALEALLEASAPTVAAHPGLWSVEVVNEPGFELGPDAGTTTAATMAAFLGHFHTVLYDLGVPRITMGSWPHYDPNSFYSDAQITAIYQHCHGVDGHFYPPGAAPGDPELATTADADSKIAAHASVVARVRSVLGRPNMPASISECGSLPTVWSERLISEALKRNWATFVWGFSSFDAWRFDGDSEPQVLDNIQLLNTGTAAETAPPAALAGFNWPNAGRTYLLHWDQGPPPTQTLYADRAVPWQVAAAHGVEIVRVFTWDAATIAAYDAAPVTVLADLAAMCTAAAAEGVQLVLSPRLDKGDIEALNGGSTYGSLALAQQAMVTSGSTPWNALEALLEATVDALDGNPGVYSYEVTNEPPYMLGADAGNITHAQLAAFLGHFNSVLKTAGAVRVNLGSWPLYDQALVSDAHLITMHTDCDLIDAHFYPPSPTDAGVSTAAQADTLIASHETFVNRVRTLLSRPVMPVMIGEFGSTPDVWYQRMLSESIDRGWLALAWGYDAYDVHAFNVSTLPEVLEAIAEQNA